jgi:ferredoxin
MSVPEARAIDITPPVLVRAGRQFLRFIAQENGGFEFIHYDLKGKELGRHPVPRRTIVMGRDSPDLVLDGEDKSLSRRHLAISQKDETVRIKDLKSLNGTYMKVENGVPVENGDEFRVGRERFVLALGRTASNQDQRTVLPPVPDPPLPAPPEPIKPVVPQRPVPVPAGEPAVTIKNFGKTIPVKRGQSICEAIEASGLHIDAECHAGACGSDPIRILEGQEFLNACGDDESGTLDDICGLEPGPCRLSCMTRPTGPVVIEIVGR